MFLSPGYLLVRLPSFVLGLAVMILNVYGFQNEVRFLTDLQLRALWLDNVYKRAGLHCGYCSSPQTCGGFQ